MPGTTPCAGLPFPVDTDPIDVAGDIEKLAQATDSAVCGISGKFVGEVFSMYVPPSPQPFTPPPGALELDGSTFSAATYPLLQTYLGSTTLPDFRERFLRHKGGSFPSDGQLGGSANTPVVSHNHTQPQHRHTIGHGHSASSSGGNHDHTNNHDHPAATTGDDTHNHRAAYRGGATVGSGTNYNNYTPGGAVNTDSDTHDHSFKVPNYTGRTGFSPSHSHTITVNAASSSTQSGYTTPSTNDAGGSGSNANLPPFVNVTFYIQAT